MYMKTDTLSFEVMGFQATHYQKINLKHLKKMF